MMLKAIGKIWLMLVLGIAIILELWLAVPLFGSGALSSNDKIGIPSLMVFIIPISTVMALIPGVILFVVGSAIEANRARRDSKQPTLADSLKLDKK